MKGGVKEIREYPTRSKNPLSCQNDFHPPGEKDDIGVELSRCVE